MLVSEWRENDSQCFTRLERYAHWHCPLRWLWSSVLAIYRVRARLGEHKGQGVPNRRTRRVPKFTLKSQVPLTETVSPIAVPSKASHVNLCHYDTTLIITPNFPITQNTERSRMWVYASIAALRPRKPQELAPTTRGSGVEEAALMAVDDGHKKAAGERLRQMEAKSRQTL